MSTVGVDLSLSCFYSEADVWYQAIVVIFIFFLVHTLLIYSKMAKSNRTKAVCFYCIYVFCTFYQGNIENIHSNRAHVNYTNKKL